MKFRLLLLFIFSFNAFVLSALSNLKQSSYTMHIVKPGETLAKIAKKYDVSIHSILNNNPSLVEDKLSIEQIIRIPKSTPKKTSTTSKTNIPTVVNNVKSFSQQNKQAKQHTVENGQTLYSISKLYNIKMDDLIKWNNIIDNKLKVGSVIAVSDPKLKPNSTDFKSIPTVEKQSTPKIELEKKQVLPISSEEKNLGKENIQHVVEKGQTLYAISKMYQVKVEDLIKWNQLTDINLKVGTSIFVSNPMKKPSEKLHVTEPKPKEIVSIKNEVKETVANAPTTVSNTIIDTSKSEPKTENSELQAVENETQSELIKLYKIQNSNSKNRISKGTGAQMETTLGAMENVYFAMHKTFSIGKVLKIKNPVNNKIVYVKIIGKLPDIDENKHVILRYSLGVKKALKLQNGKCYIQIEYAE